VAPPTVTSKPLHLGTAAWPVPAAAIA